VSSSERNLTTVRRFVEECWGAGNVAALGEVVADGMVGNTAPLGPAGMGRAITYIRTALPDFTIRLVDLSADGDRVVWRYACRGTHTGAWLFGVPPTGKEVAWTGTTTARLADGKIAELWDQMDREAMDQVLGLVSEREDGAG
jgi:predicted ester cyclase